MSNPCKENERAVRIRVEIVRLLAYPQVGPFGAAVIARNLGAPTQDVQSALDDLVAAGRLHLHDGWYSLRDMSRGADANSSSP